MGQTYQDQKDRIATLTAELEAERDRANSLQNGYDLATAEQARLQAIVDKLRQVVLKALAQETSKASPITLGDEWIDEARAAAEQAAQEEKA